MGYVTARLARPLEGLDAKYRSLYPSCARHSFPDASIKEALTLVDYAAPFSECPARIGATASRSSNLRRLCGPGVGKHGGEVVLAHQVLLCRKR